MKDANVGGRWQGFVLTLVLLLFAGLARAESRTDIEYAQAGGESLKLDAFVPEGDGPFPTVIIVHGGGWRGGDKQFAGVKPLFEPLSKAGFAWFSIDYRLAPKHHFPAPVEDVETAIRWVKAHARQYKVDPQRIALAGESAGAHLIAMATVQAKPDTQVAAVIPFYGPFDLEQLARAKSNERAAQAVLGLVGASELNEEAFQRLRKASPIHYVRREAPPFLLIHGTADRLVPYEQSVKLCEKLKSVGAVCELFPVEDADHGIGGWEKQPAFQAYKSKLVEWLVATLPPPTGQWVELMDDLKNWRDPRGDWTIVANVAADPQDPKRLAWKPGAGAAVNGPQGKTRNLLGVRELGDIEAHIEFMVPAGSNSGVYFMGRYEVQVYDSCGVAQDKYPGIECGGIYPRWIENQNVEGHSPRLNASLPPGQWQTFDVTFRAPRFDSMGKKTGNALFVKVLHNGKLIHENVEVTGPTRAAIFADEAPAGPLMLQGDHGPVAYRSVRIRALPVQE
jgi:acetyl esterase